MAGVGGYNSAMRYHGNVIRPPSEAYSYILQITYGCSHNRCTFCGTYRNKPFAIRPPSEIMEDIELARIEIPDTRRVFLADGDAMVLSMDRLLPVLDALGESFPKLERVGIYANARDLLRKSEEELALLCRRGLGIVYLGLESGSDDVLRNVRKGATASEMVEAVHRAKASGLEVSVIAILGIAGPSGSEEHARATGRIVSEMDPQYLAMLTLMLVPGTELHQQWEQGSFELLDPRAMLVELRNVIQHLDGLTQCVFRTNHASNYLPLRGMLPRDKEGLLAAIDGALALGSSALRPESWRRL
jgi:radical SAM superfamily enzyme YgiQ (UPF0313 family)